MRCPRPDCSSYELEVTKTSSRQDSHHMPKIYRSMNLTRRNLRCMDCGHSFVTYEMLKEEFEDLRHPNRLGTTPMRPDQMRFD